MTANDWIQLAIYFGVLLALTKPLGLYMARVYQGQPCGLDRGLEWLERLIYRLGGVDPSEEMSWKKYAAVMLLFNFVGFLAVYALLRLQAVLPLNPHQFAANSPDLAFDTAASFATNTNWQSYGGETTLSYLSQMLGLGVQNFLSAACGMAVLVALIRGLARRSSATIGNFWHDLVRTTVYVLLPMALVLALVLVSQGVIQNFKSYETATLVQPVTGADGKPVTEAALQMGPAASQIAIKQLGTNGGGFFNVNSAHPFENPTPLSNFFELLAILMISSALCYTFGVMVGDTRQGWAVLAAMFVIIIPLTVLAVWQEQSGVPAYEAHRRRSACVSRPAGRQHGRKRDSLRYRKFRVVGIGHDCGFQRQRELDARFVHAIGRIDSDVADSTRRDRLWRRGERIVWDADVCDRRRVCGRIDGRPHAGISGQEDRSLRNEDGFAGDFDPAAIGAGGNGDRGGWAGTAFHRSSQRRNKKSAEQSGRARFF